MWRATKAAEAGLKAAAQALREAETRGGVLHADGEPLTCERLSDDRARRRSRPTAPRSATSSSAAAPQTATGHGSGVGPIARRRGGDRRRLAAGPRVRVLLRHRADVRGRDAGPGDRARGTRSSGGARRRRSRTSGPACTGRELWSAACDFFEAEGFPTQRKPGAVAMEGFPTALGHGVGLEVHEEPGLGRAGTELRRRRRDLDRAVPVPAGPRRRPGRGHPARDRRRRRGDQLAPDRPGPGDSRSRTPASPRRARCSSRSPGRGRAARARPRRTRSRPRSPAARRAGGRSRTAGRGRRAPRSGGRRSPTARSAGPPGWRGRRPRPCSRSGPSTPCSVVASQPLSRSSATISATVRPSATRSTPAVSVARSPGPKRSIASA